MNDKRKVLLDYIGNNVYLQTFDFQNQPIILCHSVWWKSK